MEVEVVVVVVAVAVVAVVVVVVVIVIVKTTHYDSALQRRSSRRDSRAGLLSPSLEKVCRCAHGEASEIPTVCSGAACTAHLLANTDTVQDVRVP